MSDGKVFRSLILTTGQRVIGEVEIIKGKGFEAGLHSKAVYSVLLPCELHIAEKTVRAPGGKKQIAVKVRAIPFTPAGTEKEPPVEIPATSILCWLPPPDPGIIEAWHNASGRPYVMPGSPQAVDQALADIANKPDLRV